MVYGDLKLTLTQGIKRELARRFDGKIRFDEPMAAHTSFHIGGPADALVFPESIIDITALLQVLETVNINWFVLGGGTNLLVRDGGIRGVVISPSPGLAGVRLLDTPFTEKGVQKEVVDIKVESGISLWQMCRFADENGFSGLAFAAGIPGTVGGAIMMNAGTPEGDLSHVLIELEVVDSAGKVRMVNRNQMGFEYRSLTLPPEIAGLPGKPGVIVSAVLRLNRSGSDREKHDRRALLLKRKKNQPGGFSAGSFFKNPPEGPSAGELIDRAGLKGYCVGDSMVSEKHANFLINRKDAAAEDILSLMEIVQKRVYETFGINLEPEVKIIGEETSA